MKFATRLLALVVTFLLTLLPIVRCQTTPVVTTLYSFTGGTDGSSPYVPLVQGTDGNFYGTTLTGGSSNVGTVFSITPAGVLTTLHSFVGANGVYPNGLDPQAALLQGSDGKFYGTT